MINKFSINRSNPEVAVIGENRDPRSRILDAALKTFIEKGPDGGRTREIADAAGVNVAMVHYYFGSKARLYKRVVQPLFMIFAGFIKMALSSSDDPRKQLEALVDAYFDFLSEHPELPRLLMWELAYGGKNLKTVFVPMIKGESMRLPDRIIEVFQSGQESGMFSSFVPLQAAISLVGLCVFPFLARSVIDTVFQESFLDTTFIKERRHHVKALLLKGLSSENSWLSND